MYPFLTEIFNENQHHTNIFNCYLKDGLLAAWRRHCLPIHLFQQFLKLRMKYVVALLPALIVN